MAIASKKIGFHEKFHDKIAIIDDSVFYHGSMNILSQSDSSESMIAFRARKTIGELVKIFGIRKAIRTYQNLTGEDSSKLSIIRRVEKGLLEIVGPEVCSQCGKELVLTKGSTGLFFVCPNLLDKRCDVQKDVDKTLIKQTILSMKLKCGKCQEGHMVYRDGRFGPFLGCDQYFHSHCRSRINFDDDIPGI